MSNKGKFFVVRYMVKPRTKMTNLAGWMEKEGNVQIDEQVGFVTRLRTRDLQEWQVILDLTKNQVVKSTSPSYYDGTLFTDRDFDKLLSHYKEHYGKEIDQFIAL